MRGQYTGRTLRAKGRLMFFFFSSRRRHTRCSRDWSSDVCSSDLPGWNSPREQIASGVMMIPVPISGILERVSGEETARAIPGITELTITARLRDAIAAWPEGSSYLGFLFARGDTPEKVEESLRKAYE